MKNDKSLINELLREDGIEPFGVSDKERRDLRDVLEAERRRVKRLAWLVQVPLWFFAVLMLLFCVSERLLDTLRIQFVAGLGLVLVAWVVLFPISFKLLGRLKAKRARLRRLYKLMPEYAEKCRGAIIIVGRRDGKRVIRWPAVITLGITISLITGLGASGVYYLLSGRWSPIVILYAGLMGIGGVAVGVYDGLKTAPEELTELKASESSIWRMIMKSRITKLAAAVVVMVGIVVVGSYFTKEGLEKMPAGQLQSNKQTNAITSQGTDTTKGRPYSVERLSTPTIAQNVARSSAVIRARFLERTDTGRESDGLVVSKITDTGTESGFLIESKWKMDVIKVIYGKVSGQTIEVMCWRHPEIEEEGLEVIMTLRMIEGQIYRREATYYGAPEQSLDSIEKEFREVIESGAHLSASPIDTKY